MSYELTHNIFLRGAMLARCQLPSYISLSVCPSVKSRCSIEKDGRIELVFGSETSFVDLTLFTAGCE